MFESWVTYVAITVAGLSLIVAALALIVATHHLQPGRQVSRRQSTSFRLDWKRDLPIISIKREQYVVADNGDLITTASFLESLGVNTRDAERNGINKDHIAYLAVCIRTLLVQKGNNLDIASNFLEHRMLRRLLEKRHMRRAWPYARPLAPPENREQVDHFLRERYPSEIIIDVEGTVRT